MQQLLSSILAPWCVQQECEQQQKKDKKEREEKTVFVDGDKDIFPPQVMDQAHELPGDIWKRLQLI